MASEYPAAIECPTTATPTTPGSSAVPGSSRGKQSRSASKRSSSGTPAVAKGSASELTKRKRKSK